MRSFLSWSTLVAAFLLAATPSIAVTTVEGQTDGGAYYEIVVPDLWNGDLIIWNHGFDLSAPGPVEDLEESFFVQLLEGYAVAASSYRQSGWALFKTNKDLKALVREFEADFGPPESIVLIGASLGGIVTAAALEKAELGNVVGALTLCGAMAGSRNWDGALDFRLLYDVVCAGVPGAAIPGGAKGLPKGSDWTRGDVEVAVNECTGVDLRRSRRSAGQQANLDRLVTLARIPGQFVQSVMWYATFGMSDLVHDRGKLRGKIGTGNRNVDYGDAAVNEAIERVRPKKKKARKLARHFTPKGRVGDVKIISLHTDKDGLVIVENESEYAAVVPARNLTTAVVVEDQPSHCLFSPAEVIAAWEELRRWIDGGPQPTAADIQAECRDLRSLLGGPCRIEPDFEIPSMDARIRPR
jgi:pimeloyl-ACP methyl ester carboxylesterase